jgi:Putative mono-oxygenase ydhR/Acyl-CoA dehydrogenase, C-terminal domain/Nitronate monooxygenase
LSWSVEVSTALLFRFPFKGPWEKELTEASHELARDIANEDGLVWKIWLEGREMGQAGGIYLFEDAAAAGRYRDKHAHRLAAMGLTGVMTDAFSVNTELSVLTMARAALGEAHALQGATAARPRLDDESSAGAQSAGGQPSNHRTHPMLSTSITRAFGLTTPVVNAGMAMIARPALAAAVCEAGGLGTIGADINPPDVLRHLIRQTKTLTKRPFGVDLIGDFVTNEHVSVLVEEQVALAIFFWTLPSGEHVKRLKQAGSKVWMQVGRVDEADQAVALGVDALIIQGAEAGGHNRAEASTMTLFPDTARVLRMTRYMVGWSSTGVQMGAFEATLKYTQELLQFGKPIASFQVVQDLLAKMIANVTACQCLMVRLAQMDDDGKLADHHASLAKAFCTPRSRETVAWGRELLGGNGIVADFPKTLGNCCVIGLIAEFSPVAMWSGNKSRIGPCV